MMDMGKVTTVPLRLGNMSENVVPRKMSEVSCALSVVALLLLITGMLCAMHLHIEFRHHIFHAGNLLLGILKILF